MPRIVLIVLLIFLAAMTAAVASYLLPATPVALEAKAVRPLLEHDPSVIVGRPKVKLVVFVVFDQMRGDYIVKWNQYFPPGGFKRLMNEGCWFSQCYYPYATTTTGPGHSSILAGTTLDKTGIINNEWYDRNAGTTVNCATTDRYEIIFTGSSGNRLPTRGEARKPRGSGTPDRMISPTLGDNVKAADRGSKVIGVSLKDRAAIFPSGHHADAAYWFGSEFITSTYYTDVLPLWVRQFNASKYADQWFGAHWDRSRPDLDYGAIAGPDKGAGEASAAGLGITFPHPIDGGKPAFNPGYYGALVMTPFGNDLLLEFAERCIDEEKLGQRDAADMLTISFSSNDLCGHAFGPDSQEVFDMTLRSDRVMANLLGFLDRRVGLGNYTLVVTADHGICPMPEVSVAKKYDPNAKRVDPGPLRNGAEEMLAAKFGKPLGSSDKTAKDESKGKATHWIESFSPPWIYLNDRQIETRKLSKIAVADALANWLRKQDSIERVYTARELKEKPSVDAIDGLVKASFYPERSGDLYLILKPYCLLSTPLGTGTTHGSPYQYDRHVPLVVYGPHLPRGEQTEPVTPQHAAAILADVLGVKPPRDAIYPLPNSIKALATLPTP